MDIPDLLKTWPPFARRLRAASHVCLMFDFDGTLAPIAASPGEARIPAESLKALQRLAASRRATLAVVSGRPVEELIGLVGLPGAWYSGTHGFEIRTPAGLDRRWFTRGESRMLEEAAQRLDRDLAGIPGSLVERKPAGVAVHYRQVDPDRIRDVQDAVMGLWRQDGNGLRLKPGSQVLELLPRENRNKGTAVRFILGKIRRDALPVYFGDDVTDLDAFRALRDRGLRIGVGDAVTRHLDYRLEGPAAVEKALQRLCRLPGVS